MTHFTGRPGDFDFLLGAWTVENRRLKERGAGSADWETFSATHAASVQAAPGGGIQRKLTTSA